MAHKYGTQFGSFDELDTIETSFENAFESANRIFNDPSYTPFDEMDTVSSGDIRKQTDYTLSESERKLLERF